MTGPFLTSYLGVNVDVWKNFVTGVSYAFLECNESKRKGKKDGEWGKTVYGGWTFFEVYDNWGEKDEEKGKGRIVEWEMKDTEEYED